MKIAVLSDSHDNIPSLREAVAVCNRNGAGLLIHCGDLISPFMLEELARFNGTVHLIYGNNSGDQHLISGDCGTRFPAISHHGVFGAVEAGGRKIAFTHYPQLARGLAAGQGFDVVCCGHNHRYQVERMGACLFINPGELLGKDARPSFCILDTESLEVEKYEIGRQFFSE